MSNYQIQVIVISIIILFSHQISDAETTVLGFQNFYKIKYSILRDPNGDMEFSSVKVSKHFIETEKTSYGFTKDVVWVRFDVALPENSHNEWFIEIGYPLLNSIDVFLPEGNHKYILKQYGNTIPFNKRDILFHNYLIRLNNQPGTQRYFIRFKTDGSMIIPISILSFNKLISDIDIQKTIFGLFYGALIIIFLYNLFLAFYMKDIIYFFYSLFIISIIMVSLGLNGYGFQYIWSNFPWMNNLIPAWMCLTQVTLGIFTLLYVGYRDINIHLFRLLIAYITIAVTFMLVSIFIPYNVSIISVAGSYFVGVTLIISICVYMFKNRKRQIKFYIIAFSFLMIGVIITVLNRFGFLPDNFFTLWSYQFGIVFCIALFSLGLADNVNALKNNLAEINIHLEDKVRIRTDELAHANEKLKEMDKVKSNFFANISHEIRTPLTLILSPVESALQGDYKKNIDEQFLQSIQRNSVRLLRLINNLLDFSKIEAGKMSIKVSEINIVQFIQNYISAIKSSAESKGIQINLKTSSNSLYLYLDFELFEKIIMNLLSNALKFTDQGGNIDIIIRDDNTNCYITVQDTGIGIPSAKINSIFERFIQADISSTRKYEGTGIGLALVKELVEIHEGKILVKSRYIEDHIDDHGSEFIIVFPKGKEHFIGRDDVEYVKGSEIEEAVFDQRNYIGVQEIETSIDVESSQFNINSSNNFLNILIVEDNPDMRSFLTTLLADHYNLHYAVNGQDGLDKIKIVNPDAVITDVMMPLLDGYQMTKKIKEDDTFKRIPVLMLTAKADIAYKIEGLEYGADDYLTKPFNSKELLVRLKTLLKNREYEKEIEERQNKIDAELRIARLLQQKLLPENIPLLSGYQSHVVYIPMDMVGGDFYDYKATDNVIELLIADVSGHGLPGAFLAMITKMAFESIKDRKSTKDVLNVINEVIFHSTVENNYVTVFYCRLNRFDNTLMFSNAGHFPPIIYCSNSNEFIELNAKGNPLGWFKNIIIEEKNIQVHPGDRIFLYTDGITECSNSKGDLFGDHGFKEFIRKNTTLSPIEISQKLMSHLRDFSGNDKFDDDLCLIVFDIL